MDDHEIIPPSPAPPDPASPVAQEPAIPGDVPPQASAGVEPPPPDAATAPAPKPQWSSMLALRSHLTRRQVIVGSGLAAGVVAVGGGILLALQLHTAPPTAHTGPHPFPSPTFPSGPLPPSTPVPASVLQAWRTKQLTVSPAQRFQHHTGASLVPLGIIEPTYPGGFQHTAHVHLYLLGGELVGNQLFWYGGLEAQDGTQFVAKLRVGPVDQPVTAFGLQLIQQSTDDIEGGPAEEPQVSVPPRTLYAAMPDLIRHCLVVTLTPQPASAGADGLSSQQHQALTRQAAITNQFLQFDFDVLHRTPFAQIPASERTPIQGLIDTSPIRYHSDADGAHYPLITRLVFRHSDQLYAKLVSS